MMDQDFTHRTNIIGADEIDSAVSVDLDQAAIHKTNRDFWDANGSQALEAIALPLYGAFISEQTCQLFGDISGKKVLEIGCGAGQSLQYLAQRGAAELWGVDISSNQLQQAQRLLRASGYSPQLICAPMEAACGIPQQYFDYVYSVYAIGWASDLDATFRRIASYLKKDGVFIFSWSHPIHKCVAAEGEKLTFKKSYFDESWYKVSLGGQALSLSDRMLSTYINALVKAGLVIEQMVEQSDPALIDSHRCAFASKASMLPVTFVIKASKR